LSAVFVADWRACPPSFWRSWTQEQIAEVLGLSRNRVSEIIGNTNFGNIDTLLSQGHDMDYMSILNRSGWAPISLIVPCLSKPEATQQFQANIVAQMQKNRTLGIVRRSLLIGRKR
jgi:transcriptional regulator with XRE-family HTH domain